MIMHVREMKEKRMKNKDQDDIIALSDKILKKYFCENDLDYFPLRGFVGCVGFVRVFCHYLIIRSTGMKKCALLRLRIVAIGVV